MKNKELEIATSELLNTIDMKESMSVSFRVFSRIREAYKLEDLDREELCSLRMWIVKYFVKYFNENKSTINDLLVYSAIIYTMNDYVYSQCWEPQIDSKELLKDFKPINDEFGRPIVDDNEQ